MYAFPSELRWTKLDELHDFFQGWGLWSAYRSFRPHTWLFGNASGTQPMNIETAQRAYQGARQRAAIMKAGG
ncbi:MAG: hypothetical protein ABIR56_01135, partial [Polaromonas sp.]